MVMRGAVAVLLGWGLLAMPGLGCGGSSKEDASPGGTGGAGGAAGSSTGGTTSGGAAGAPSGGSAGASTGGAGGVLTAKECFKDIGGDGKLGPNYDQFNPKIGSHCYGTNHQDIQGVERLVFIGDSVTAGTPPTPAAQFYRALLGEELKKKFANLEIADCSKWGARTDDFLAGQAQLATCFPTGGDSKKTLVVFTIGGNDISPWAKDQLTVEAATIEADKAADLLNDTVKWFKEPSRFPNGVYLVFANPYEYTDASGDLFSCPTASLGGLKGNWLQGAPAVIHFQERFMKVAVDHQVDMIFTLEHFCGHGYKRDDVNGICYRGPNAELWFDLTCIHPNPTGHAKISEMFAATVNE